MSFKIASTRDLMSDTGEACFPEYAFKVLKSEQDIEWEWLEEDVTEITPAIMARYDGLHVNLPTVTSASVSGSDCKCKIIARNGVGYDTVDLDAMTANGIVVTNTPIAVRRPVAVATLTLLFALAGKLFEKDKLVRSGKWDERVNFMGNGLTTRTLGLIGAGSIGQEIMRLAQPFFGRIVASDPYVSNDKITSAGGQKLEFNEVLQTSDFVVVCSLLTSETRHLMDSGAFSKMKPTAYFLNVGRGPIHEEKALINALDKGIIAGAGLDVTEVEPIPSDSPLLNMRNTIITPHALCWTDECFADIAGTAFQSIVDFVQGKTPMHVVNKDVLSQSRL